MRLKRKLYIVLASMGRIKTQQYETTDEELLAAIDQMQLETISKPPSQAPLLAQVPVSVQIANAHQFKVDLEHLINKYSQENGSDTPDFILADYLTRVLEAFEYTLGWREHWYGRSKQPVPSGNQSHPSIPQGTSQIL